MPSLTAEDIAKIAHLARLSLRADEVPAYGNSMTRIMALVGELEQADTGGIEPMAHPLAGVSARLRPDVVSESNQRALNQRNATQVEAGLYLVPRVIE
jgi:aspartyl-tRNA(Asn)/glutamyl-tRNA(Gln) amidotransferase subunit C